MTHERPNLLFLFSDQHAQRVAGCYGNIEGLTPNLDRLAREGVVFDNVYCPSPLCVPSRMSMLTGRYPYEEECWTNDDYLRSDAPTWLHALGAAGYRPVLAGRLHSMGPDQLHGYAERMVGDHSPNWSGVPRHDLGVLAKANDPWRESLERSGIGQSGYQVKDAETNAAACDYLRRVARARRPEREPFCLTVGYLLPHPPYVAWREDYERFDGRVPPPVHCGPPDDPHPWEQWWRANRGIDDVPDHLIEQARTAYYALVHRLDIMIGELLGCLDDCGLGENTLVVYTTDHGDQLGERGLWWKHTLYEESVRVPAIMRWPARFPAGARRPQVANLIDVAATMVEAMGGERLPHGHGRSLVDVARGVGSQWNDETYCEHCTDVVPAWTGGRSTLQRMVRTGPWKLIYHYGDAPQLFDLAADPHERRNLFGDDGHAAVRERLTAKVLDGWDPAAIAARIQARRLDKNVVDGWARTVLPRDEFRWEMRPEHNRLEPLAS